jgi:xanthine dehydrogenase accessory factor
VREGRPVTLARVIERRGFSGAQTEAFALATPGQPVAGRLLSGAADDAIRVGSAQSRTAVIDVDLSDADAPGAGLSCGGAAQVLLVPFDDVPAQFWDLIAQREPACLITDIVDGRSEVITRATVTDGEARYPGLARLFNRGASATALLGGTAATSVWPVSTLVVVGDGLIAAALVDAGTLLGWSVTVVNDTASASAAIAGLSRVDGLVILSHDRATDGPALLAALDGHCGYLAALGARHTQAARAEWLAERGVTDLSRVHGPAGLDLGARTPAEIAVAIVAEMLAVRNERPAASLRGRVAPIHEDGLNAPPPRY